MESSGQGTKLFLQTKNCVFQMHAKGTAAERYLEKERQRNSRARDEDGMVKGVGKSDFG